jgi:hypothetical protein
MKFAAGAILIFAAVMFWPQLAAGQSHEPRQPTAAFGKVDPSTLYLPSNDTESRIMKDTACVCGSCKLEPIAVCKCDFAAKMRKEVKERTSALDLSTAESQQRAYETVRAALGAAYGMKALTPKKTSRAEDKISWLPGAIFLMGLGWVTLVAVRSIRRGRRNRGGTQSRLEQ